MSGINTRSEAGQARYQRVRAAFIAKGSTLTEWCRANGLHIQNVRDAYFGRWKGPGANAWIARVEQAAEGRGR